MKFYDILYYDEESKSCLRWAYRNASHFNTLKEYNRFLTRHVAMDAGTLETLQSSYKRWRVRFGGKSYLASRIVYILHNNELMDDQLIDHIDGDPLNNKIQNLRIATHSENRFNSIIRSDNTTGIKGIQIRGDKFIVEIMTNGLRKYIGSFDTQSDAKRAYNNAASELHGKFARF